MSSPKCEEILSSLHSMTEARTKNYNKILRLKGKLDIMTHQITARPEEPEDLVETNKEALLVYQDDSSDELNDHLDDMLMPASDTDNDNDDWNDDQEVDSEEEEEDEVEDENIVDVESDDENDNDEPMVNGVNDSSDEEEMDED